MSFAPNALRPNDSAAITFCQLAINLYGKYPGVGSESNGPLYVVQNNDDEQPPIKNEKAIRELIRRAEIVDSALGQQVIANVRAWGSRGFKNVAQLRETFQPLTELATTYIGSSAETAPGQAPSGP